MLSEFDAKDFKKKKLMCYAMFSYVCITKNEDEKYTFTTRIQKTKIDKVKVDAFTTDIDAFLLYVLNKKKFEAK